MSTNAQTGTTSALTIGSRTQLGTTVTTAGTYVLKVDTNAMTNGDSILLESEVKPISGGTRRIAQRAYYSHAQGQPIKQLLPEPEAVEVTWYITQTAGTGRAFPWAIALL